MGPVKRSTALTTQSLIPNVCIPRNQPFVRVAILSNLFDKHFGDIEVARLENARSEGHRCPMRPLAVLLDHTHNFSVEDRKLGGRDSRTAAARSSKILITPGAIVPRIHVQWRSQCRNLLGNK